MKAEIFYFDGCPSYKTTHKNLKAALKELRLAAEVKLVLVDSPERAEALHFQGSPSIRIDGRDLENVNEGFTYGCRVYSFKGKLTGAPTKEYIKEKINQHVSASSSKDK